jgi:thymidylate synthase
LKQYLGLAEHILLNGQKREDRTGTGTLAVFGAQVRYDLSEGFPLMTTKDMMAPYPNGNTALDSIIYELLWFLNGDTDLKYLNKHGVRIWNPDGYRDAVMNKGYQGSRKEFTEGVTKHGYDLGRIYGAQWRSWMTPDMEYFEDDEYPRRKTIDQIANVLESIKKDPFGRRHIVNAWNPGEIDKMALPPCHVMFQFYVDNDWKLSCQLYQRSADMFLGVPFNIASYALLTMMIADQCGLGYGEFIHTFGDAHIYLNHVEQMTEQIQREPKPLPKMIIRVANDIFSYKREDFALTGYEAHPAIKGDVSVGL